MVTAAPQNSNNTLASHAGVQPLSPPQATGVVAAKSTAAGSLLDQEKPIVFNHEIDRTNTVMKNWLYMAPVGTKCVYMELEFIVVDSRKGKWLLGTKVVTKEPNDDRRVSRGDWINNFFSGTTTKNLALISPSQVFDIIDNTDFFPQGYTYMMNGSLHGPEFGNTIWRTNAYKVGWHEESLAYTFHRDGSDLCALRYSLPLC